MAQQKSVQNKLLQPQKLNILVMERERKINEIVISFLLVLCQFGNYFVRDYVPLGDFVSKFGQL